MRHIEYIHLASPRPRRERVANSSYHYTITEQQYLAVPNVSVTAEIGVTLLQRRSRRVFGPLSVAQLSTVLWYTAKILETDAETGGMRWQHRPTPSAGGCHPIDILVITDSAERLPTGFQSMRSLCLYDAMAHSLGRVQVPVLRHYRTMLDELDASLPHGQGTILLFTAQFGRTLAKYENGESLVWRDAGALLATIGLAAEGLGLQCCALGVTGQPWLSRAFRTTLVEGVGGCILGERVAEMVMLG